jgi:RNA polymerase primary sigma factor
MGRPEHDIRQWAKWDRDVLSLETPVGNDGDGELIDWILDWDTPPVEEFLARHQLQESVRDAVARCLEPRDRAILGMRFGLDRGWGRPLEEVAQAFNITRERVRQIEKRALKQLRHTGALGMLNETLA